MVTAVHRDLRSPKAFQSLQISTMFASLASHCCTSFCMRKFSVEEMSNCCTEWWSHDGEQVHLEWLAQYFRNTEGLLEQQFRINNKVICANAFRIMYDIKIKKFNKARRSATGRQIAIHGNAGKNSPQKTIGFC